MNILELFSGTESFSKVARARGHECFTIDIEKEFSPNLCKDIMELELKDIPFKPDVIWCSPPCQRFSVASLRWHWKEGKPRHEGTWESLMLVSKTISLILALKPKFWFIENPRGMLRKQSMMINLHRKTLTYCQYGDFRQKPTDIWTNLESWNPKPKCSPGDDCHESAQRGADKGTQSIGGGGKKGSWERARLPRELCLEIIKSIENDT
tara:strand:+ start:30 stop:656 length:627 start_codon:yes stop_codon:yes gene_type:complete